MSKAAQAPISSFDADCRKYISLHAKASRLQARMDALKERIKPDLANGAHSPKDLPYLLVLQKKVRTLYKWEEACRAYVLRVFGDDAQRTDSEMAAIEAGFEKRTDSALKVEINKAFAAKVK